MEWRIILPVLCLIGILHLPGNAAQNSNSSNSTAATILVNVVFKINQTFQEVYSNLSHPETILLANNITAALTPIYQKSFPNFHGMSFRKFSPGSIVADSVLQFNSSNNTSVNMTEVKKTLTDAIGNLSIPVDATSINVTDISATNATVTTAAPTISTNTSSSAANTTAAAATTPPKTASLSVVFKIIQPFKDIYSDLANNETKQLAENITNAVSPFYGKRFKNFRRMSIRKFSQGSIVVDSALEFDTTNNTSPNMTDVKNTLTDAITNGNLSIPVDAASINVTDISATNGTNETTTASTTTTTTSAATTSAGSGVAEYNITFKLKDTFNNDLLNMSSAAAVDLTKKISDQLTGVYKRFANYIRTRVWRFRSGSVDVDAVLEFNKTISGPNATDLAKTLADGVRNGTVTLQIDPTTIKVTDPSGFSANKSPVLASMLTAFWMTLASLLLSAVMH